jgi:flagellar biosynthesis GTPase FlhF
MDQGWIADNMRSSKSRSRNKSNRNRPSGNIVNRVFDSSGPEGKVRGTPQQVIDKYNQLARDSQLANDRVATENFQQHAEHYQRMLNEAQREQEARREEQERQNRERQAERDRERRERMERQEREANSSEGKAQPASDDTMTTVDPSEADQPDLIVDVAEESALVETPETQPEAPKPAPKKAPRKRAPRKKAPAPAAEDAPADAPTPAAENNDAAE